MDHLNYYLFPIPAHVICLAPKPSPKLEMFIFLLYQPKLECLVTPICVKDISLYTHICWLYYSNLSSVTLIQRCFWLLKMWCLLFLSVKNHSVAMVWEKSFCPSLEWLWVPSGIEMLTRINTQGSKRSVALLFDTQG